MAGTRIGDGRGVLPVGVGVGAGQLLLPVILTAQFLRTGHRHAQ